MLDGSPAKGWRLLRLLLIRKRQVLTETTKLGELWIRFQTPLGKHRGPKLSHERCVVERGIAPFGDNAKVPAINELNGLYQVLFS